MAHIYCGMCAPTYNIHEDRKNEKLTAMIIRSYSYPRHKKQMASFADSARVPSVLAKGNCFKICKFKAD